jgi:YHS domain-containing protein/uncharacterized membrane protein HdeD (DUF308 family)
MGNLELLEERIREKLAVSDAQWHAQQEKLRCKSEELLGARPGNQAATEEPRLERSDSDAQWVRYDQVADQLLATVIRPRMELLARCFENARISADADDRHGCCCTFEHTPRFPARAFFAVGLTHLGEARMMVVQDEAAILPAYVSPPPADRLVTPLEEIDEERVKAWLEGRILAFLDAYLQVETAPRYQEENVVSDPVCGVLLNKSLTSLSCQAGGRTFYFCGEPCRARFLQEMARQTDQVLAGLPSPPTNPPAEPHEEAAGKSPAVTPSARVTNKDAQPAGPAADRLLRGWKGFLALGAALLVAGLAGGANATMLQLTSVLVFGPLLMTSSAMQLMTGFLAETWMETLLSTIAAALEAVLGFYVIGHPLKNAGSLFAVMAILLATVWLVRLVESRVQSLLHALASAVILLTLLALVWRRDVWSHETLWLVVACILADWFCSVAGWKAHPALPDNNSQ